MSSYSAFFSSGLLAPYHAYTSPTIPAFDLSPVRPSSPLLIPSSPIQVDTDEIERSTTPTPSSSSRNSTDSAELNSTEATQPTATGHRLRKRRSSLTVATSPMNTIKSPVRSAGAALRYAHHSISITSPSRNRSGSLGLADAIANVGYSNIASEGTSLVGRMRSGSVGGALRPRKFRRGPSLPIPFPAAAPPPTVPLPPLPALPLSKVRNMRQPFGNSQVQPLTETEFPPIYNEAAVQGLKDRVFSVENNRIDEEMKEN